MTAQQERLPAGAGSPEIGGETELQPNGSMFPLVGHFFHTFTTEEDGCRLVDWQGQVIARAEDGFYLVELYSWLDGSPHNRQVVHISQMAEWWFYDTDEWMHFNWEHTGLMSRTDRHVEHRAAGEVAE